MARLSGLVLVGLGQSVTPAVSQDPQSIWTHNDERRPLVGRTRMYLVKRGYLRCSLHQVPESSRCVQVEPV